MTAAPSLVGSVRVVLAIKTVTEGNSNESWRTRSNRARRQRAAVAKVLPWHIAAAGWVMPSCDCPVLPPGGVVVTLTRLSPGNGLDPHDNLPGSQKHVVDEITKQLGLRDDRSPMVTWRYDQTRTKSRDLTPWGVEVRIEER